MAHSRQASAELKEDKQNDDFDIDITELTRIESEIIQNEIAMEEAFNLGFDPDLVHLELEDFVWRSGGGPGKFLAAPLQPGTEDLAINKDEDDNGPQHFRRFKDFPSGLKGPALPRIDDDRWHPHSLVLRVCCATSCACSELTRARCRAQDVPARAQGRTRESALGARAREAQNAQRRQRAAVVSPRDLQLGRLGAAAGQAGLHAFTAAVLPFME
eukprot:2992890-Rhodomonas_salina.4